MAIAEEVKEARQHDRAAEFGEAALGGTKVVEDVAALESLVDASVGDDEGAIAGLVPFVVVYPEGRHVGVQRARDGTLC